MASRRRGEEDLVPWWAWIALAAVAVEFSKNVSFAPFSADDAGRAASTLAQVLGGDLDDGTRRRLTALGGLGKILGDVTSDGGLGGNETPPSGNETPSSDIGFDIYINGSTFNMTVPCVELIPGLIDLLTPCGNVSIPKEGLLFTTPFGVYHMPGTEELAHQVRGAENWLSHYTLYIFILGIVVWLFSICCIPSNRVKLCKAIKDTCGGKTELEEDDEENPPSEEEKKSRLDPDSDKFIAKGNIYRLLAVLHPGIVGMNQWLMYASKALICAYMQLFLPYNVIKTVLMEWNFIGIKSPLWFVSHATKFTSMVAALGTFCSVFAGKCAASILEGAEANVHILSHREPKAAADGDAAAAANAAHNIYMPLDAPEMPDWAIKLNELFWCSTSMLLNIAMSMMLEVAMFLKVATFTGNVEEVAIVAGALYLIMQLDDRVMESNNRLKTTYRKAVGRQTEKRESHPCVIPVVASIAAALVKLTVPLGIFGIILFAWKNRMTGFVIGGDGLTM